ncbi:MAG: hypothetical protein RO257_03425 [Candidatus Kapabacteria bacterium]|nr:hypothetical protein [Candidatus Kapabacteria bacterium]
MAIIISNSCNFIYKSPKYVSLRENYENLFDSLKKEQNDFIIYYKGCNCNAIKDQIIYTLINNNNKIEILKIDNTSLITKKFKSKFDYIIFEDMMRLVNPNDTTGGPQISNFDDFNLNLRIKNFNYNFNSSVEVYNIAALNYIKAILFDVEVEKSYWE